MDISIELGPIRSKVRAIAITRAAMKQDLKLRMVGHSSRSIELRVFLTDREMRTVRLALRNETSIVKVEDGDGPEGIITASSTRKLFY